MSTERSENNDLNAPPGKESDVTDFEKGLDALLNKEDGSEQEAVEVMTAKVKEYRRKYADRRPWVNANYFAGEYFFGWATVSTPNCTSTARNATGCGAPSNRRCGKRVKREVN